MRIEKRHNNLTVYSSIYFDENVFCIRPYVFLVAFKEFDLGWPFNSIGIAIHDYDDFDIGLIYKPSDEHFTDVLHELINWMHDHEQGISLYEVLQNPFEFFPDCNCENVREFEDILKEVVPEFLHKQEKKDFHFDDEKIYTRLRMCYEILML